MPESLLERLRSARSNPAAVWLQFSHAYAKKRDGAVYAFLEGRDDITYYTPAIRTYTANRELLVYDCGGKHEVLAALHKIEASHSGAMSLCVFFVDADLDRFCATGCLVHDRVYVTSTYSFDNGLITRSAVTAVLVDLVLLDADVSLVEETVDTFEAALRSFHRIMMPLMAASIHVRRQGGAVRFDAISIYQHVKFIGEREVALRRLRPEHYQAFLNGNSGPTWTQTLALCREVRRSDPKTLVRGKYELQFLCAWAQWLSLQLSGTRRSSKPSVTIETRHLVAALSARIPYPPELLGFLRRTLS